MRTIAVAVAILGACLMQEVSGSVFLGQAPSTASAALKENTKDDKQQHLVVDKKAAKAAREAMVAQKRAAINEAAQKAFDEQVEAEKAQFEMQMAKSMKAPQDKQENKKEAKVQDKKEAKPDHKAATAVTAAEMDSKLVPKASKTEMAKANKAHEEALKKMSETNGAPSQGFNEHSEKTVNVEHDDMKTQASDWGGEWPQTDETDSEAKARICRTQEVQSKWCKEMGFASLLERSTMTITPMEDSYDPYSDANNPENAENKHDEEVHGGDFFQTIHHSYDDMDSSTMAIDRVSSPAEQYATNRGFVAPHHPYDAVSFLQTSQSSQPKQQSMLEEYQDEQITQGLEEAETLPREAAPESDYE